MPREETRHPFTDEEKGRVLDPNPERRRYLTEIFYKYVTRKISRADLMGLSKKKLSRLAEIGYVKYKYGRYPDALQVFKTLATLDNINPYYQIALGGVFQKLNRHVDAVISYTRALQLNPKDLCPHVNRGEIYLKHRNYKKAAEDFRNAILLDPNGRNLWANRARSLVIALKRSLELKKRAQQAAMSQTRRPSHPHPARPRR